MSRLSRGLDRVLGRGGMEARELHSLVQDDLISDEVLAHVVGRLGKEDLEALLGSERLRVRPMLVALSARAAGAAAVDPELQHAAELLHLALTVHDVTLGQPGGRRRRVARRLLKRFGGSHLTVRALELVRHVSPPEIMGEAVDTLRAFADGEALSRHLRESGVVPERREALEHADVHDGALLAFCCRAGGYIAGGDVATVAALGRYGRHVGRLWTLAEDQAGLTSDEAPAWLQARAAAGRPVLAVAVAAERDDEVEALWGGLVQDGRNADILVERLRTTGALASTREAMAQSSWTARQALRNLPESPYRQGMDALAGGLARAS